MENATKALIIAAAVLIAIVLVALGVKLLSLTSNIEQSATQTGEAVTDKTGDAISSIIYNLTDVDSMSDEEFNKYIKSKYHNKSITGKEVRELCNIIKRKYGSLHKSHGDGVAHITCSGGETGINCYNIETKIKDEKKYYVWITETYSISVKET